MPRAGNGTELVASTGPRYFKRGGMTRRIKHVAAFRASTGPRYFKRGGKSHATFSPPVRCCFNGAALFQARRCPIRKPQ